MSKTLPALPDILLLTWFGTIPCFDLARRRLTHVAPEALDKTFLPLGLKRDGGTEAAPLFSLAGEGWAGLPALEIGKGMYPRCVTFLGGTSFMIAKPVGSLEVNAKAASSFENFLPLLAKDFLALREILSMHWRLGSAEPVPLGLDKFKLKIGASEASLWDNLPLNYDATLQTLSIKASGVGLSLKGVPLELEAPVIWINPLGNIGNRALQYLTAVGLAARVPGAKIQNIKLEMWNYENPFPRPPAWKSAGTGTRTHLDLEGLADCLVRREVEAVCIDGFAFHLDHYPPRPICRQLLPAAHGTEAVQGFGSEELVCSVRAAEILKNIHPDYLPLPPGYYAKLQEESGLELVFFGQLGDDAYSASLRKAFPAARFVPSVNQNYDFELLRRSRNVALSISTFAWLATWLGDAERIYLPVGGMFSPVQHPSQDYLPLEEDNYRYILLPPVKSVNLQEEPERFQAMQDLVAKRARFADREEIREIRERAIGLEAHKTQVKGFSSPFYLMQNPDAAVGVRALQETALNHYLRIGAREKRPYRPFDALFYADAYPDAAEAVALGYYPSLFAHFLEIGEKKGYAPTP